MINKKRIYFQAIQDLKTKEDITKYSHPEIAKILKRDIPELSNDSTETVRKTVGLMLRDYDLLEKKYSDNSDKLDAVEKIKIKTIDNEQIEITADEYKKALRENASLKKTLEDKDKLLKIYKQSDEENEKTVLFLQSTIRPEPILFDIPKIKFDNNKIEEVKVAQISDIHFDEVVLKSQVMNFNEYNQEIAKRRLWKYLKTTLLLTEGSRFVYNINQLNIFFLGDMISGMIHDELIETNETNVTDSMLALSDILTQMVIIYADHFKKIVIDADYGNHGRIIQKKGFKNRHNNFDYILYHIIKLRLKDYIERGQIEFKINKSPYGIRNILGWRFLHSHGDDIKSWNQISYYGAKRRVSNLKELYESEGGFDYWFNAHTHERAWLRSILTNGSAMGMNEYSLGISGQDSPASQNFIGVNKEYGMTHVYDIKLNGAKRHEFK